MKAKTVSSYILLLAVAACQQVAFTAQAAVTFGITPSAVSNLYAGPITLQIGGLGTGETVRIDKFLDVNGNGVIDAADWPVQSFLLTDGKAIVCYDGTTAVTNINVPGDSNPTSGAITAQLSIASDITQEIVAQYLFRLSSPTNHFPALTNLFNVTNSAYAQSFTGAVQNGGTNVPNAIVMVTPGGGKHGNPFAGVMANNSGNYSLNLPGGAYSFYLFKSNFVANLSQAPLLTLTNGATFTTNLHFLIPAINSISGRLVDAANTNIGLPGNFMICQTSDRQLMAGACYTGTNGAFTVPVIAGQWQVSPGKNLASDGYLGFNNDPQADTTSGSVSNLSLALPKATALFYGSVLDGQGHPFAGIDVSCQDNNGQYQQDYYTDTNGYFVAPVVGGSGNGGWQVQVSSDSAPANYLFSQPSFDQNGGTNLNPGQALLVNFTAVLATNHISGSLKDNSGNPIANVGIWANATINGVAYSQDSVSTDTNGNYSLNVANGTWTVGVSTCGDCGDGLPGNYFPPADQSVVISNNNGTANFTALLATNHISGWLKDTSGNPIANVGIWANATINGVNYNQGVMGTDINGNYSLNVVNGTWTVNVSSGGDSNPLPGNYLCPASQTLVISNNNGTANFTALLATNMISGYVTNAANQQPLANVGVYAYATINGVDYNQYLDTDGNGHYAFNVGSGSWYLGLNCGGGSSDSLEWLGFQCVSEQSANIANNNAVISFTVQPSGESPLQITTTTLPSGTVGVSYNQSLSASGGQPSYTWWLPGGTVTLPPGQSGSMNFSPNGTISGTPSTPGTYLFWVGVNDSASPPNTVTQQVSLTILQSVPDVSDYYVLKMESFLQVDPTSNFVLNTNFGPFTAYLGLVQTASNVVPFATVDLPTGLYKALSWGSAGLELQSQESFANQALIDAAYPPGNYTFGLYAVDDHVQYPMLSMPSAAYPNPPHVSNFAAAQSINPLSPFTLQWDAIAGATASDSVWVVITDTGGNQVFSTTRPSLNPAAALPGTATSVLIPTNTFQTGHAYVGWVSYYRTTSVNMSAYPQGVGGVPGVTLVAAQTSLPLTMASTSSRPKLDQGARLSASQFHFQLTGAMGQNYTVQASTNLASTNWFTLMITNLSANPVFIQDNQATNKQRFYRVKVGP